MKCNCCGKDFANIIIDFIDKYKWCARCWREYLKDWRSARMDEE